MTTHPAVSSMLLLSTAISAVLGTSACSRTQVRAARATIAVANVAARTGEAIASTTQGGTEIQWASGWVDHGGGGALLRVVSGLSDKCLSVPAGGARLVQYHCHDGGYQLWRLEAVGRRFRLIAGATGQCLHLPASAQGEDVSVAVRACHDKDNQLWELERADRRHVRIRSSVSRKCLHVADRGDGLVVVQRSCEEGSVQRWRLELLGS